MKGLFQALQKANRAKLVESHLGIAFKLGIKMKVKELAHKENESVKVIVKGKEKRIRIDYK